jgi:hypothetical protein
MKNLRYFLIFIALSCFITTTTEAQQITWGKEIPSDCHGCYMDCIFERDPSGVYTISGHSPTRDATLSRYQYSDITAVSQKELTPGNYLKKDYLLASFFMKGKILFILQRSEDATAYLQKSSTDGTLDPKTISMPAGFSDLGRTLSSDSSTLIISYVDHKQKKIHMTAYNSDADVVWTNTIDAPVPADAKNVFVYRAISITGNELYMLLGIENKHPGNYYEVAVYDNKTLNTRKMEVKPEGEANATILDMVVDKSGDIICGGYYTLNTSVYGDFGSNGIITGEAMDDYLGNSGFLNNESNGTFYMRIDHTNWQISAAKTNAFGKDLLAHYMSPEKAATGKKGIEEMRLKKIIVMPDKSVIIAGEQYASIYAGSLELDYDDAVIQKVNADGSVAWEKNIAKKQRYSSTPNCYSYFIFTRNNDVCILYNDNIKNLALPTQTIEREKTDDFEKTKSGSDKVLMMVTIDQSGTVKRQALTTKAEKNKLEVYPCFCAQISPSTILLFRENDDNTIKFGKLQF